MTFDEWYEENYSSYTPLKRNFEEIWREAQSSMRDRIVHAIIDSGIDNDVDAMLADIVKKMEPK